MPFIPESEFPAVRELLRNIVIPADDPALAKSDTNDDLIGDPNLYWLVTGGCVVRYPADAEFKARKICIRRS